MPSGDSLFPYAELQVEDGLDLRQVTMDDDVELFAAVDDNIEYL